MEECINYIKGLLGGDESPTQIRVNEPWQSTIKASDIFTGDSPLLPSSDIVVSALSGEEHMIVFIGNATHRAILSL